jgi:hypothetical protein
MGTANRFDFSIVRLRLLSVPSKSEKRRWCFAGKKNPGNAGPFQSSVLS